MSSFEDDLANDLDVPVAEFEVPESRPIAGILGMTRRELLIVVLWVCSFALSFFAPTAFGVLGPVTVWMLEVAWILPVGLPTAAVFLLVLRRFSPDGIRRVGSLGVDQFASVAFSVAAVSWGASLWMMVRFTPFPISVWATVAEVVVLLALVICTVFAPLIPGVKEDFEHRVESLAHRNANPARPVLARTSQEHSHVSLLSAGEFADVSGPVGESEDFGVPGLGEGVGAAGHISQGASGVTELAGDSSSVTRPRATWMPVAELAQEKVEGDAGPDSDVGAAADAESVAPPPPPTTGSIAVLMGGEEAFVDPGPSVPVGQPFWALAPETRTVCDERGGTVFEIGPDAWILVLEDRGSAFVVRHEDGRVGYLHDITDMTRG